MPKTYVKKNYCRIEVSPTCVSLGSPCGYLSQPLKRPFTLKYLMPGIQSVPVHLGLAACVCLFSFVLWDVVPATVICATAPQRTIQGVIRLSLVMLSLGPVMWGELRIWGFPIMDGGWKQTLTAYPLLRMTAAAWARPNVLIPALPRLQWRQHEAYIKMNM